MAFGAMITGNSGFTQKFVSTLFLLMHPVGTPYISKNPTSPAELYGGTWERIEDCTIWGASDSCPAGTMLEAGLPDITGTQGTRFHVGCGESYGESYTGAFQRGIETNWTFSGVQKTGYVVNFAASLSNAIYGASDTVQPPAYSMYIWQRVA